MQRDFLLFETIEMRHVAKLETFLSELEKAGARVAVMRINSPGGSWQAGQLMRARMLTSKIRITTVNEGLVGSAATLPFAAGNVRQCQAHAKFMMHQVSGEVYGQVKDLKKAVASQEALNRSTAEMYVAASNKTVDEWEQMMEAETWLGADQAQAIGFCTECLPSKPGLVAAEATMQADDVHKYYMSLIPKQDEEMKLDEVRNALGKAGVTLAADASEADVLAAIEKLRNATPATTDAPPAKEETELEKALKRIKELEQAATTGQTQRIDEVINNAVNTGRIVATQKDNFRALLNADFTNTAKIINDLPPRQSTAKRVNGQAASAATIVEARADWDFDKWSKEDEKGLLDIKRNDPDRYQNLINGIL